MPSPLPNSTGVDLGGGAKAASVCRWYLGTVELVKGDSYVGVCSGPMSPIADAWNPCLEPNGCVWMSHVVCIHSHTLVEDMFG